MLLIEPGDNVLLPEQYRGVHNVCVKLHDQLLEILIDDVYSELKKTRFSLEGVTESIKSKDGGELLDWFAASNRHGELTTVLTKNITCAMLSDFLQFVYESLNSAKKGKFSVAYALSRKSFTDELLIFEQLLNDKEEFIQRFYLQGEAKLYDPASRKLVNDQVRKDIISQAASKVTYSSLFDADFLFELRYDKVSKYGLNWISNQALHIVTTDENYKTENNNFNFIFSVKEDFEGYWQHYYKNLPYLLFYTASVVDEIVFQFLPDKFQMKSLRAVKRFILFVLYSGLLSNANPEKQALAFGAISEVLKHTCKMCDTDIVFDKSDFELLISADVLLCPNCLTNQFADSSFMDKFLTLASNRS
jgi:hypothetical protein